MRCLLREKFFVHALELFFNLRDLLSCHGTLLIIQFHCLRAGQPPLSAVHDRSDHLQIANQFGAHARRRFFWGLPLRFEKQRRIVQNALANRRRSSPPSRI
jgi:hypothetical protein